MSSRLSICIINTICRTVYTFLSELYIEYYTLDSFFYSYLPRSQLLLALVNFVQVCCLAKSFLTVSLFNNILQLVALLRHQTITDLFADLDNSLGVSALSPIPLASSSVCLIVFHTVIPYEFWVQGRPNLCTPVHNC